MVTGISFQFLLSLIFKGFRLTVNIDVTVAKFTGQSNVSCHILLLITVV